MLPPYQAGTNSIPKLRPQPRQVGERWRGRSGETSRRRRGLTKQVAEKDVPRYEMKIAGFEKAAHAGLETGRYKTVTGIFSGLLDQRAGARPPGRGNRNKQKEKEKHLG